MRLGKVYIHKEYIVDLDDEIMIQEAKDAIKEDFSVRIRPAPEATIDDIPEFLKPEESNQLDMFNETK